MNVVAQNQVDGTDGNRGNHVDWRTACKPGGNNTIAQLASAAHASIDDIVAIDAAHECRSIVYFNPSGGGAKLGSSFGITLQRRERDPIDVRPHPRAADDLPEEWDDLVEGLYALTDAWRERRREHPAIAGVYAVLERLGACVATFDGAIADAGYAPRGFMLDGWWAKDNDEAVLILRRNPADQTMRDILRPASTGDEQQHDASAEPA